ncbi:Putative RHS-repeat-containing toxin [Bacteriophage APSE-3]|nr:Putative RHS-repeat-containing toxin [Bacteriophage APSE-3]
MGPSLSLALLYSPLSTVNNGFGIGFRLNLSQYNKNTRQLFLSNGEEYRVGNNEQVKQQKLKNFIFKKRDKNSCQIIYKSGLIESLSLYSGEIYVPTKISSPDGRSLNLAWDSHFSPARLTRVTDDDEHILCSVAYPDNTFATTRFTLLPDNSELSHKITFTLMNEKLKKVTSNAVDPTLAWSFDYDDIGPQGRYRAITAVHSPTGLIERVSYYTQPKDSMAFPNIANLPPLPCVHHHTLIPGGGQHKSITTWTYTKKNYLGKDAPMNAWHPDHDSMLNVLLADYQYGSTAELKNENDITLSKVTKRYNSYHLLESETTVRDGKTQVSETEYYAKSGAKFDDQPINYALPKTQTESWSEPNEKGVTASRNTVTYYQFDEFGNPVRQEAPDGTISEYTYYPATGEGSDSPADPHGFTRYVKTQTVTPPKKKGDEPISTTRYIWQKLETLTGNGYAVVQKTVEQTTGNKRSLTNNSYYADKISPALYGRINRQDVTLTSDINRKETFTSKELFTYNITANEVTESHAFTGQDGLTATKTTVQNLWTGTLSEISVQGTVINYAYDKLGRLINRTTCPGSDYENTTTWEYGIDNEGLYSIENDASGNKDKTHFDGAGRTIKQQRFDAETAKWYETFSCTHNSLGEVTTGTVKDHLPAGSPNNYPLTSNITYGGWGEKKAVSFSDGRKSLQQTDPIALTQTVYSQGGTGNTALTSASVTTTLDKISQLPLNKIVKDLTGAKYSESTYQWDGLGQLLEEQDELGRITQRTYDEYGRVLTQALPDGTVVSRTYAPHLTGNAVAFISVTGPDANGASKTWVLGTQTFDSLGRVTQRVSGGRTTAYRYQGVSPTPSTITLPSGKAVEYTYIPELGNAFSSIKAEGISQTFNYDKQTGKLLNAQEASAKLENTWSKAGQLKEEVFLHNAQNRKAKHKYTLKGAPVSYTDITGKQTQYSMDAHGRVTRITDDSLTVNLTYDALGRLNSQTVRDKASTSSLATAFNYDSFGREITRTITDKRGITLMLSQTWLKNGLLAARTTQKNGIKLREEQYGYDNRNRLIRYTASGDSLPADAYGHRMSAQTYRYDALNNLTSVKTTLVDRSTNTATYSYQNASDPTQLTTLTNTHDNYPKTINLSYDAEGRMTRDEAGRTLTYDVMGRLTGVSDETIHRTGTYSYDALNRLITRHAGNNDIRELYYRGAELVNEVNTSANKATRLVKTGHTCLGVSDDKGLTLTAGDKNDSLLWSEEAGTSAEGELHVWSPYGSGKTSDRLPGFNGERVDPVSGTYHLGNGYRAYNPVLMRFNCPDSLSPFGAGGINPYAYCAGDPINHTDPSGHISGSAIAGIALGTISLVFGIATLGSSIAAGGAVIAALGIVSDVTGIASAATEDSHPEASSALGWASLATGLAGIAVGIGKWAIKKSPGNIRNVKHAIGYTGVHLDDPSNVIVKRIAECGITDTQWRVYAVGEVKWNRSGAFKMGADTEINCAYIRAPLEFIAKNEYGPKLPIFIMTGGHGFEGGNNYATASKFWDKLKIKMTKLNLLRAPELKESAFLKEDIHAYVVNIGRDSNPLLAGLADRVFPLDTHLYSPRGIAKMLSQDKAHVINGFCFGSSDEIYRSVFNVIKPISYS